MPRVRSRSIDCLVRQASGSEATYPFTIEFMDELYYPGSTPVLHWKSTASAGTFKRPDGSVSFTVDNHPARVSLLLPYMESKISEFYTQLDSSKLPTNTGLAIIQSMVEFSESLDVFTAAFWRRITYGSFTWGILPLVGELKSLLTLLVNLEELMDKANYETSNDISIATFDVPHGDAVYRCRNGRSTIRHSGKAIMGDLGAAVWLDALGYYPDLATLWDLTPLSFAVNWLLPVGSFLESYRRPWITHVPFQGWMTAYTTFDVDHVTVGSHYLDGHVPFTNKVEVFRRAFQTEVLTVPDRNKIDPVEFPSLREGFNLLYLAALGSVEAEISGRLRGGQLRPNGTAKPFRRSRR